MIRINLLPYREKKKQAGLQKQVFLFGGSFLALLLILGGIHLFMITSIRSYEGDIKEKEEVLARLNKIAGEVEIFKKDKNVLEKKLSVISRLEENRLAPVRYLNDLNSSVPIGDAWIDRIILKESDLKLEGVARNNMVLSRFMRNLEGRSFLSAVDLVSSTQKEYSGMKFHQFVLNCKIKKQGI